MIDAGGVRIRARIGGSGPPVLLLHGHPQTHLMWHKIAPRLASRFTVVAADLRGYGESSKPESTPDHEPYSKRAMARDQIALMRVLGFTRFAVVGHDRGARVAYRMALDEPDRVERLAVLDIIPTGEALRRANKDFAMAYWHWFFLSQPYDLPERLIGADPDYYFNLGYTYWQQRDIQASIYWLREALRRSPADGQAHFVLGLICAWTSRIDRAIAECREAIKLKSQGKTRQAIDRFGEAAAQAVRAFGTESSLVTYCMASRHELQGRFDLAVGRRRSEQASLRLPLGVHARRRLGQRPAALGGADVSRVAIALQAAVLRRDRVTWFGAPDTDDADLRVILKGALILQ